MHADVEDARDIRFQMQAELKKELGKQSSKSEGFVDSVEPKYCKCGVRVQTRKHILTHTHT
jgi:hypothetical protein